MSVSRADESGRTTGSPAILAFERDLRPALSGEIRTDRLSRTLYATDASIYEMTPDAVVLPKTVGDIVATVRACREYQIPLTARGAGTGLTGGAVNRGVQLDCSRWLNRIVVVDPERRLAYVEPGVVLDDLNAALVPHGLQFAPDVATSSRATIGGMIANNSCGAHSVLYGRTCDHIASLDVVLADGSQCRWGNDAPEVSGLAGVPDWPGPAANPLARGCDEVLAAIARDEAEEVARRFPKLLRSNGGYALDRLCVREPRPAGGDLTEPRPAGRDLTEPRPAGRDLTEPRPAGRDLTEPRPAGSDPSGSRFLTGAVRQSDARDAVRNGLNTEQVICGSEGTLAIIAGATLRLIPLPRCKVLLVAQFHDLNAALEAVCPALEHHPAAVELIDDMILRATRDNLLLSKKRWWVQGDPPAVLVCELFDDDPDTLGRRLAALEIDLKRRTAAFAFTPIIEQQRQADVWDIRKRGLGLLMSRPGERQPHAFIEDTTVAPARLPEYIRRLDALLAEEGVAQTGHYAHASVGCLHVRPVLNLRQRPDIQRMRRIAERACELVVEFGGAMNGEHGDGLACSIWLERLYGPRITAAFARVKQAFDPENLLNPGKIVAPLPMHENLRYGGEFQSTQLPTVLDFSAYGGMAGLADMCTGVGLCRQRHVATMCPSYMATGDETHTTRARANALRVAMSNRGLLEGLSDPALAEVMDLCIGCKACKTECPTGVDMARLKAEWLHQRHQREGVPRRSRFIARSVEMAGWGSFFAPLSNWLLSTSAARRWLEQRYGLDRRAPMPRFARPTFRHWWAAHRKRVGAMPTPVLRGGHVRASPYLPSEGLSRVVYFVDTWTNFYHPEVGQGAVQVLEALGHEVIVPPTVCCGRPLVSQGLLEEARHLAERNVALLAPYVSEGIAVVGTEPSCVSMMLDEWPQLLRAGAGGEVGRAALRVSAAAQSIERFVAAELEARPSLLRARRDRAAVKENSGEVRPPAQLLYHGHCHQKALWGTADALGVLRALVGTGVEELNTGCCGMAGAFGHEVEHYDIARRIGEDRLFPAIRAHGEATIAVSGFSCREHIAHHTNARPRHWIEYVAGAL